MFYQISCREILCDTVSTAQGTVEEESELGDVVDLGQKIDLQDDLHDIVVNISVTLVLRSKRLETSWRQKWKSVISVVTKIWTNKLF